MPHAYWLSQSGIINRQECRRVQILKMDKKSAKNCWRKMCENIKSVHKTSGKLKLLSSTAMKDLPRYAIHQILKIIYFKIDGGNKNEAYSQVYSTSIPCTWFRRPQVKTNSSFLFKIWWRDAPNRHKDNDIPILWLIKGSANHRWVNLVFALFACKRNTSSMKKIQVKVWRWSSSIYNLDSLRVYTH